MKTVSDDFRRLLEEAIGAENASVAFSAFGRPASVSVRANPFKHFRTFDDAVPVQWSEYGYILPERPVFTLDPLFHAGAYYVQDSSAMYVGKVFRDVLKERFAEHRGILRVLDLCAAPGGKTTDIAASLRSFCGDAFILVSNEIMKSRVSALSENVAVWGDPNVMVTSDDPSAFSRLKGYFDIIVADVPCSGEGMFRKEPEAVAQWSADNVRLCAARQKRIVADVIPALADGGVLIYSTCTFNGYENDGNVAWAASEFGLDVLSQGREPEHEGIIRTEYGYALVPGFVPGEGQYCSVLAKPGKMERQECRMPKEKPVKVPDEIRRHAGSLFDRPVIVCCRGSMIKAVPENIYGDVSALESVLHSVASGCAVGEMKGKDFVPAPDSALSCMLSAGAYPETETDRDTALAFLRKDNIVLQDCSPGYNIVKYCGARLGFVKNLGRRCNNLHPQARRIRITTDRMI